MGGSSANDTRMEAPKAPTGVRSGRGSEASEIFLILSFEMLNFCAFWTLEQGDSTATVIMMFMTSAHQSRIDRLVLPIFYYCTIVLSNVASTPLSCDRLLPSLFTVHNFTKTSVGCGVSYNN